MNMATFCLRAAWRHADYENRQSSKEYRADGGDIAAQHYGGQHRRDWNAVTVSAVMHASGKEFQSGIVLTKKEFKLWLQVVRGAQTRHVGVPLCRQVWASFLKFKRTLRNKIVAQSNIIKTKSHLAKSSPICI